MEGEEGLLGPVSRGEVLACAPNPPPLAPFFSPSQSRDNSSWDRQQQASPVCSRISRVLHTMAPPHTTIRSESQCVSAGDVTPLAARSCVSQPPGVGEGGGGGRQQRVALLEDHPGKGCT